MPREQWVIHYKELSFQISPTGFKHTGLFPEQAVNWDCMADKIRARGAAGQGAQPLCLHRRRDLSLRAGGCAGLPRGCLQGDGAAGRGRTPSFPAWQDKPIRWIVDDCKKFVEREIRRGNRYDGVVMDPPSYGRGPGGEVWKLEDSDL